MHNAHRKVHAWMLGLCFAAVFKRLVKVRWIHNPH
jgi:hypothetical protein